MSTPIDPRLDRLDPPADGVELIELAGELDLNVSGRFQALVDEVVANRPRLAVIDLAEVGFVDSTILRELLRAHHALAEIDGRLVLTGVQPAVTRLLELTGTDTVFVLADTRSLALAS